MLLGAVIPCCASSPRAPVSVCAGQACVGAVRSISMPEGKPTHKTRGRPQAIEEWKETRRPRSLRGFRRSAVGCRAAGVGMVQPRVVVAPKRSSSRRVDPGTAPRLWRMAALRTNRSIHPSIGWLGRGSRTQGRGRLSRSIDPRSPNPSTNSVIVVIVIAHTQVPGSQQTMAAPRSSSSRSGFLLCLGLLLAFLASCSQAFLAPVRPALSTPKAPLGACGHACMYDTHTLPAPGPNHPVTP